MDLKENRYILGFSIEISSCMGTESARSSFPKVFYAHGPGV